MRKDQLQDAVERLKEGNRRFMEAQHEIGDVSPEVRKVTGLKGQNPFALIITCSDSRVIPEAIFQVGIGEIFVIRIAGNVIDNHQLGSIEYAADHLGVKLIVVLGHTHCGAVDAAMLHNPDGYIRFITDEIKEAIGDTNDPYEASCLNVRHSVQVIESSQIIRHDEEEGLKVLGAVYDVETGEVHFLNR
ncbi:MAG: carbonic anhydrase [Lachnospiraceae bacterium]|nr:carbonic anhydrase [Lachnospiraceae bacterium]